MKKLNKCIMSILLIAICCTSFILVGCNKYVEQYHIIVDTTSLAYGKAYGGGNYEEGEVINIFAVSKEGYEFTQWSDGNKENPRTIVVNENKSLIACFAEKTKYAFIESAQIRLGNNWSLTNGQSIVSKSWNVSINDYFTYGSNGRDEVLYEKSGAYTGYTSNGCRTYFPSNNGMPYVDNKLKINEDVKNCIDAYITLNIAGVSHERTLLTLIDDSIVFSSSKNRLEVEYNYPSYGTVIITFIYFVQ